MFHQNFDSSIFQFSQHFIHVQVCSTFCYTYQVLRRGKGFKTDKSDEVGRAIITFFPDIECKTLPTPHSDEKVMQNIAQHTDDLNPKFQTGVQDFMTHLISKVQTNGAKHGYQKGSMITGTFCFTSRKY